MPPVKDDNLDRLLKLLDQADAESEKDAPGSLEWRACRDWFRRRLLQLQRYPKEPLKTYIVVGG
jgi:hypothetical protein